MKCDKERKETAQSKGDERAEGEKMLVKKFVPLFVSKNTAAYLGKNKRHKSRNVCLSPLVKMKESLSLPGVGVGGSGSLLHVSPYP